MNKQILFATGTATRRADGVVVLTPDDKAAMSIATIVSKKQSDTNVYFKGRRYNSTTQHANGITQAQADALGALCRRFPEVEDYELSNGYFVLYFSNVYKFYGAELLDMLRKLYGQVSGLPSKVDADQFEPTDGQTVSVSASNFSLRIDYTIPFDRAAWEARHKKNAEVDTADAEAKRKQAEADHAEADAQRAAQKAKLMKTLRITLVALAIVTVVVVLALIIKKK